MCDAVQLPGRPSWPGEAELNFGQEIGPSRRLSQNRGQSAYLRARFDGRMILKRKQNKYVVAM